MDKALMLTMIKDHLGIKKETEFAEYLGIKPNVLSNWRTRDTMDYLVVYTACDFLNPDWLLSSGEGEMLRSNVKKDVVVRNKDQGEEIKEKEMMVRSLLTDYLNKDKEIADLIVKVNRLDMKFEALLKIIEIDELLVDELIKEEARNGG